MAKPKFRKYVKINGKRTLVELDPDTHTKAIVTEEGLKGRKRVKKRSDRTIPYRSPETGRIFGRHRELTRAQIKAIKAKERKKWR